MHSLWHTGIIKATLNVLVKLLPSSPIRLSPCFFISVHRFLSACCFYFHLLDCLGYARGKYLLLQPGFYRLPRVRRSVRSHIFSSQYSLCFFPFVCSIFLVIFFALVVFCFQCFPCCYFLQPLPGFQSYKGRVRLLSLEPRLFLYCPHCTTLSFRLQFPSFSISFWWIS